MPLTFSPRQTIVVLGVLTVATFPACVSLDHIAPPPADGNPVLVRGRDLYLTTCADCHVAEPVANYTAAEWHEIMPDMARKSKLSPADYDAVMRYVLGACKRG